MALFKIFRGKSENLPDERHDGYVYLTDDDGKLYVDVIEGNYLKRILLNPNADWSAESGSSNILNKPENIGKIVSGNTDWWDAQRNLVGVKDTVYIYNDYQTYERQDGTVVNIPGIKIGDGKAFLIDTPFIDQLSMDHINNHDIHITPEERAFWNNKVRAYYSEVQDNTLIFTTH